MTLPEDRPRAVLFDFDHTLFRFDDSIAWLRGALIDTDHHLADDQIIALYERLNSARTWPEVVREWDGCQASSATHRMAVRSWLTRAGVPAATAEAMYTRLIAPRGWAPYPDVAETLTALRACHIPTGIVSNVGWDIRPIFQHHGLAKAVDAYVLSCEVGAEKPDVTLFHFASDCLGCQPEQVLVVGDDPINDGAATRIGMRVHLLPSAFRVNHRWLCQVVDLVQPSSNEQAPTQRQALERAAR